MTSEIIAKIRTLLGDMENINVSALPDAGDLYDAGLTSFASVQLMLAIEDTFGIEFPETMLNRRSFSSIANIAHCVEDLTQAKVA